MLGKFTHVNWARAIMAAILSLLLTLASLTPLAAKLSASSCAMACCKRLKGTDCHHHDGAGWSAAPECPTDCGQCAAVSGSHGLSAATSAMQGGPSLRASLFPCPAIAAWTRAGVNFASFERPPPSLG
uniref:Uncharacterized protein n=1 Tax=Solibacter usitatus (strain Ellin6076) TaxID=234267 RepID=Q01WP2_SOLUE